MNEKEAEGKPEQARKKSTRVGTMPKPPRNEAGYRKPPVEHQFQKGVSGNPGGRPKGALNKPSTQIERLKRRLVEAADCPVKITKGNQILSMRKIDYITESIFDRAAKGDASLMKFSVKLILEIEREQKEQNEALLEAAIQYKTDWEIELAERKAKGILGRPDPVPHPDHIEIDLVTGTVKILGPMTPEQKKEYDEIQIKRQQWSEKLAAIYAEVREILQKKRDKRYNQEKLSARMRKLALDEEVLLKNLRLTERGYLYSGQGWSETESDE
jgi:hypothetical protein